MLKLNLKLFVFSFSIFATSLCDQTDPKILYALVNPEVVRSGSDIGDVRLIHRNEEFYAIHGGRSHKVKSHNLSPNLRKISDKALAVLLEGGYLDVNKSNEGDFVVNLNARQLGGGLGGATIGLAGGKIATSLIGHGLIGLISIGVGAFNPVAGYAVGSTLETTLGPVIEGVSLKVGLACGILLGAATGPV